MAPALDYSLNAQTPADDVHVLEYVKMLYRRRWVAVTAFLLVVGLTTVSTFTAVPIYEAHTQLLIEKERPNVVSFKEVFEQNSQEDDYYTTQYKLLQSRDLARRTITTLNLWHQPELVNGQPESFSLSRVASDWFSAIISSTESLFKAASQAKKSERAQPGTAETATQSAVVDAFLARLTISPVKTSRLVDLRFESREPESAARAVNALAREYIEQNMEFKFMASKEASDWLGQRLTEERRKVEAAEIALQRYKEQSDSVSLEERQNIVVQKLADLNAAVTKAKTERIEKESLYNQLKNLQTDRMALDSFPAILSNSFIQALKTQLALSQREQAQMAERLGDRHPDMVKVRSAVQTTEAKLQGEVAKVVQSVRNEYLSSQAQEKGLMAELDAQKGLALALNRKAIEYGVLQRDAESSRQLFQSLMQRAKETGVSGELKTSNIRIVDAAEVPRGPVRPNKMVDLTFAIFGGGMLAIGLAFFFEYLDNRIKGPEDIKTYLRLPFLGMIPVVSNGGSISPIAINGTTPNFSEAFRSVRTNVLFSCTERGPHVILITSTKPAEGKTVVASNLAVALAQTGQRVLLIDTDMRRPKLHQLFDHQLEPGLSNVLVGNAKASEAMHQTSVPGLWLLAAGLIPPNPAELIGSQRFREFLKTLGEHFEWLVLDSPPTMAVTDASILAHVASGVVFVVGADMTNRYAAQRAIERLEAAQARFLGGVLNLADVEHNGYYYSQYYHKDYANYYVQAPQATSSH
jgi:capsular exopolysaccharide synthesis family protein